MEVLTWTNSIEEVYHVTFLGVWMTLRDKYPLDGDLSGSFEQLGPEARFSKVPKLYRPFSGVTILKHEEDLSLQTL